MQTVGLTPGETTIGYGETVMFSGVVTWNDGCTEDTCAVATITNSDPSCGTLSGCLYTADNVNCDDTVTATYKGASANATVHVVGAGNPPVISQVFPFDFDQRFWSNAHTDQGITILFNDTTGDAPTSISITCTPSSGSPVTYTCANISGDYPDVHCTPDSTLQELMDYSCDIIATNSNGSDSRTGLTMITGKTSAPTWQGGIGGLGGGYIGGNTYSRTSGVSAGTITLQVVDMYELDWQIGSQDRGKAYVQIIQGSTIHQFFTNPDGSLTATIDPLPIDELTIGFKCGNIRCDLSNRINNYKNYQYYTVYSIDARDMVIRIPLMSNSKGYLNRWNETRQGRYHIFVAGTIPQSDFDNFIYPTPSTVIARPLFDHPVHIRAGLALFSFRNVYDLTDILNVLLETGDYETSISLCFTSDGIDYVTKTALPSLLVAPELIRSQWDNACADWNANPGKYTFVTRTNRPAESMPLMVVGAYANGTNFSLSALSGGLNLFIFPIYVCGLGIHEISALTSLDPPTGDTTIHIGNANLEIDLRELWVDPDHGDSVNPPVGYDPDSGVDKRITVSLQPVLPIDPARRDAQLAPGVNRRVANATDSEIESKYASTYGMASDTWDKRFVRNNVIMLNGAFVGFQEGLAVFGLSLAPEIDDAEFTMFQIGYLASSAPPGSTDSRIVGYSDWRYWSTSTDSERISREFTFAPSTNNGDTTIVWTALENGGNVNYATLEVIYRGLTVGDGKGGSYEEPGMSIRVTHVGPIESYSDTITSNGYSTKAHFVERYLELPEPISPGPDVYYYPAPQWNKTVGQIPINRNSELRRQFTYDTGTYPDKLIQRDSNDPWNRRYFKFTVPGFVPAGSESPDMWYFEVNTAPHKLYSAKRGPYGEVERSTHLSPGSPNVLTGTTDERFDTLGVDSGDFLELGDTGNHYYTFTIDSVIGHRTIRFFGSVPTDITSDATVKYFVYYRQNPKGECPIDEWYGSGAPYTGSLTNVNGGKGGGCQPIKFWSGVGPIPEGATSIMFHIPEVTPGYTTLNGVTGYIPDFWDGLTSNPYFGNTSWFPARLEWLASIININSGPVAQGGIGGPLDWNNQNFWQTELSINYNGQDAWFFYIDFSQ